MTTITFNEDLRDVIQQVTSVAVDLAGDKIDRSFNTFVQLPVPQVHLIEAADIEMILTTTMARRNVTAVTQAFFGSGISGEALLILTDATVADLSALMGYQVQDNQHAELVLEIASLLNGSCIQGFCSQLDVAVLLKHPAIFSQGLTIKDIVSEQGLPWSQTLAIELNYVFEGFDICCDLVLLFDENSLPYLFDTMQLLMSD